MGDALASILVTKAWNWLDNHPGCRRSWKSSFESCEKKRCLHPRRKRGEKNKAPRRELIQKRKVLRAPDPPVPHVVKVSSGRLILLFTNQVLPHFHSLLLWAVWDAQLQLQVFNDGNHFFVLLCSICRRYLSPVSSVLPMLLSQSKIPNHSLNSSFSLPK